MTGVPTNFDNVVLNSCQIQKQWAASYADEAKEHAKDPSTTQGMIWGMFAQQIQSFNGSCQDVVNMQHKRMDSMKNPCESARYATKVYNQTLPIVSNACNINSATDAMNLYGCVNFDVKTADSLGFNCSRFSDVNQFPDVKCPK
jgi:hypothetical protein